MGWNVEAVACEMVERRDNMIGVAAVYLGAISAVIALSAIIHPISWLGLTSGGRGGTLLLAGTLLVAVGWALPAAEVRVAPPRARLDEFVPVYQFNEVHRIHVAAPPERVYLAVRQVTAGEISFFQLLTWIRRFGRPGPESILHAPERLPIIDVATRTTFLMLADDAPRELVFGTVVLAPTGWKRSEAATPVAFKSLTRAGFATAAMNFRIDPDAHGGSVLTTETCVFATDPPSRRRFAAYWRVIYPGSAIIRRSWLRAIRRRAEGA
jgi:hypothetical protein